MSSLDESISLTRQQKEALRSMITYSLKPHSPVLTVGGYAGTGKTTLISIWRRYMHKTKPKLRIGFVAYTGKASRVLALTLQKFGGTFTKDSIGTIHSLIYAPLTNKAGAITAWKLKQYVPVDLIVIDEASMVDGELFEDLLSYGIPIIAVGDHGQLPPIGNTINLMASPDLVLTQIHRQAKGHPIIDLSVRVRNGEQIGVGVFGPGVRKLDWAELETREVVDEMLASYSINLMVLVGYNASRVRLNQSIRHMLGFYEPGPQAGDVVICLKNNWDKNIYNGMLGVINHLRPLKEGNLLHWYDAKIAMTDSDDHYAGRISAYQFNQTNTLNKVNGVDTQAMGDLFDFGYALTVHKAQGGQAPEVLLFEERNKYMSDDDWARWLYTGITRAQERLTIIGSD
jgi:exodeoxyribonuclease V